jgi:hypothetical protein
MKKTKLRDKKVLLVPFSSMTPSSSASFRRSGEQEPKTPITVQLMELRRFQDCCCVPALRWPTTAVSARSGGRSLTIYIAGDREAMFCRNSSIPSITSSITDTLSSKPLISFLHRSLPLFIFSCRIQENLSIKVLRALNCTVCLFNIN